MYQVGWTILFGCLAVAAAASSHGDFETFTGFSTNVGRSQSLQPEPRRRSTFDFLDDDDDDDDVDHRNKRQTGYDLSKFERISPEPKFTQSGVYISPADADRRYTRSPQGGYKNVYTDGYQAFLDKYFSKDDEDDGTDVHKSERDDKPQKKNSNYRQGGNNEDVERIDNHRPEQSGYSDTNNNDNEYDRIKSLSQQQEKEIKQNPKHCKVVLKDDMKCSLCKNPETGAHSESCSFSSTPAEKKYAYIKERNYNSKDDDDEDDDEEEGEDEKNEEASNKNESKVTATTSTTTTEPSPVTRPQSRRRSKVAPSSTTKATPRARQHNRSQRIRSTSKPTTSTSTSHRFSSSYKAEESRPQERVIGLDPFLYGSVDKDDKEKSKRNTGESTHQGRSYEDYFSHVFPEAKNGKLQRTHNGDDDDDDEVELLPDYDSKKNVEKVLAEFKKKDWSTCKKVQKGDLTCYHCKDEKGVRHEECMYVSGSSAAVEDKPKSSRLSYSETKEYHHQPNDDDDDVEDDGTVASSSKLVSKTSGNDEDGTIITTSTEPSKKQSNRKKASRKLVIRKRKAKVIDLAAPKPEDVEDYHAEEKKTIKRMVTYVEEESSREHPNLDQTKSVVYEHHIQHIG